MTNYTSQPARHSRTVAALTSGAATIAIAACASAPTESREATVLRQAKTVYVDCADAKGTIRPASKSLDSTGCTAHSVALAKFLLDASGVLPVDQEQQAESMLLVGHDIGHTLTLYNDPRTGMRSYLPAETSLKTWVRYSDKQHPDVLMQTEGIEQSKATGAISFRNGVPVSLGPLTEKRDMLVAATVLSALIKVRGIGAACPLPNAPSSLISETMRLQLLARLQQQNSGVVSHCSRKPT